MASTQEFYKLRGRNPRYVTKLSAFANGMYLTNQAIPEGYARLLVNYDIDSTGSHIKPRPGRQKLQTLNYNSASLGPVALTDYIYAYNKAATEIESTKDVVLSYGLFTTLEDLIVVDGESGLSNYLFVSLMDITTDTNIYYLDDSDEGEGWVVQSEGTVTKSTLNNFWALMYNNEEEKFEKINNNGIGYVAARGIKNAYAFDKPFSKAVGVPISAVLNNELYAFTGKKLSYNNYVHNIERSEILGYVGTKLNKVRLRNNDGTYLMESVSIPPRSLNPLEAVSSGYNLLSPDPYVFNDEVTAGGSVTALGAMMYEKRDSTLPLFSPAVGQSVEVRVHYAAPNGTKIKVRVEQLNLDVTNSDYEMVNDFKISVTASSSAPIWFSYIPKYTNTLLRITLRNNDDTTTDYATPLLIQCNNEKYINLQNKTFNLNECKGMISWQGCLGVYGVPHAMDTIFFSDVEDPSYFPFPNNTLSFDNEILAVHNYLDHLIVVTVDSIWLVTPGTTVMTSTQKRILANIYIPEIDAVNLVVLKDEIFFKTDSQFYVLKPNKYTSDATDLKNYVNSTAIDNFTQDFKKNTVDTLNTVYKPVWQSMTNNYHKQIRFEDFDVVNTKSIVRNEDVHYIYTIVPKLTDGIVLDNLNMHFVYNTLTRSWRMYFVAIGNDNVYYNPVLYKNKQSGAYYELIPHTQVNGTESSIIVSKQTEEMVTDNLHNGDWSLTTYYNNYPYIDTGNVALDDSYTKRFRELQINLTNNENTTIRFHADFKVDGRESISATKYEIQHITDKNDPDYGKIYVSPIESDNLSLYGATISAPNVELADYWSIDLSKFPDLSMTTVRFELQGRGRRGSLQLLNTSLKRYELSDINWVYRIMNGR